MPVLLKNGQYVMALNLGFVHFIPICGLLKSIKDNDHCIPYCLLLILL